MKEFIIQGQSRPVKFTGTLLAGESTETHNSLRWLELTLYRVDSGVRAGQYVLHRTGQSVVYHRPNTCGYGVSTQGFDVPPDAEPCPICKPREISEPGTGTAPYEVWLEAPRHKVITCPAPEAVEKALLMRRKDGSTFLSTPAANLLAKASKQDAKLKDYFEEAEEL